MIKEYEILNGGEVINVIKATPDFMAQNFTDYREKEPPPAPPTKPVLPLVDIAVTESGEALTTTNYKYYLTPEATITVTATIEGGEAINAPMLKMVGIKQVDDQDVDSEIYFTGSIVDGVLTVSGKFPISTNYRFRAERNNRALDRMHNGDSHFYLTFPDLDFLA